MKYVLIANLAMAPVSIGIIIWFIIRVRRKNKQNKK